MATPTSFSRAPDMQIDPNSPYGAVLQTSSGPVRIELFADQAPRTVNNFVFLARQGFYDGTTFHRVIPGFVIQGGDPTGTGRGGPGYRFDDELDNDLQYEVGTLAMANAGPNTNGCQFFIVAGSQGERLPKAYSVFGRVQEGMEVVQTIASTPTGPDDRPVDAVVIEQVTITEG